MKTALVLALLVAVAFCATESFDGLARMNEVMPLKLLEREVCILEGRCPTAKSSLSNVPCVDGMADEYPCSGLDLLSFVPLADMGSNGEGNDIWGWTDPVRGDEWAIMACTDGTAFVNITEPTEPMATAWLPTATVPSVWRDVKVYNNYAFIGSEASDHGMQIVDLRKIAFAPEPETIEADARYMGFGSSHNIVINEDTGYAYAVGTRTCNSGLHVVDISDPLNPVEAGCYFADGYVHDAQCVVYNGPDSNYSGREICWCYNEDTVTVVDVTDKSNMFEISKIGYDDNEYTHQGWLDSTQRYAYSNDELDESYGNLPGHKHTRTLVWDYADLQNPVLAYSYHSSKEAIDHNLYVNGDLLYEANYCAGLRILDISSPELPTEVMYFDVDPDCDRVAFAGAWSNYPFFESGNIIVSSIERGLFVVAPSS